MTGQVNDWVNQVLGSHYQRYRHGETWSPVINLYEINNHYCIVVDLAGLCKEEIDIQVEEDKITISGCRDTPKVSNCDGAICMHLMEIDHGPFRRTIELPENVEISDINASYREGYLWIQLHKKSG